MGSDALKEKVPRLRRRAGDMILANENNSTIILGRDRVNTVDSGYGMSENAGAIQMMTGRKHEDPSVKDDPASIYLSAKTDPDEQAGTDFGPKVKGVPAVIMRADCVRISGRTDVKISAGRAYMTMTSEGKIVLDGEIQLGEGAADRLLKGDAFAQFWSTLIIQTPSGPSSPPPPLPPAVFSSRTVRVR